MQYFYFTDSLRIGLEVKVLSTNDNTASYENVIIMKLSQIHVGEKDDNMEAYHLTVKDNPPIIEILGSKACGVFYGVQTLLALINENMLPVVTIKDEPRYPYRGMHLDVSRNFHSKAQVFKLLDVMAMYKMNKFHFHLTDDEGWRIEIPDLEELTKVIYKMFRGKKNHNYQVLVHVCPFLVIWMII